MPREDDAPCLSGLAPLVAPILACARGDLPVNIALMHVLMTASDPVQVRAALRCAEGQAALAGDANQEDRVRRLQQLWEETPDAWRGIRRIMDRMAEHSGTARETILDWARSFDRMADEEGDLGVALYALGRNDLLEAATNEVVDALRRWGPLNPSDKVLEIGCGSGRFLPHFAKLCRLTIGIDISHRMLLRARDRCRELEGVFLIQTGGRDLAPFADRVFDLVLAIDSFPYLVAAGGDIAQLHIREAARVLRPGGRLIILNYSYRDDPAADRRELADGAARNLLSITRNGTRDFSSWDAAAFVLERRS